MSRTLASSSTTSTVSLNGSGRPRRTNSGQGRRCLTPTACIVGGGGVAGAAARCLFTAAGRQDPLTAVRHRVPGVGRQVEQNLQDLSGAGLDGRQVGGQ